jgi:hypothetical protein
MTWSFLSTAHKPQELFGYIWIHAYIESHAGSTINHSLLVCSLYVSFRVRFVPLAHAPCTANEGPVRIQYKCLVPIFVLPEMKLCGFVISKTEL